MHGEWRPYTQANGLPVCGDLDPTPSRFYIQQTKMSECFMEYSYHLLVLEKEIMFYALKSSHNRKALDYYWSLPFSDVRFIYL